MVVLVATFILLYRAEKGEVKGGWSIYSKNSDQAQCNISMKVM